jgi:peptidoglycan/LPS O-acetylase OafA/YrhL
MRTLADVLHRDRNNFDLIRLIAALSVMLGHSYGIQPAKRRCEPILAYTGGESSGSFAVFAFLILSGMLVSASYARQRSVPQFVALRLARIWPAFAVCAALIAFVIGPAVSTLPLREYYSHPLTLAWFIHAVALIDGVQHYLPGVFDSTSLKHVVNGPMWSLPLELKCYVIVLVAGLTGAIRSKRGMILVVTLAFAGFRYLSVHPPANVAMQDIIALPPCYIARPFQFFLLGMLLYAFREYIFIDGKVALALIVIHVLLRQWATHWATEQPHQWGRLGHEPFLYLGFVYGLLWVASSRTLSRIKFRNDYSYGIYLYGFIIQQVVSSYAPELDNFVSLLITVPITVLIAAMSWHIIEKPCLTYFRNKFAQRVPVQVDAVAV